MADNTGPIESLASTCEAIAKGRFEDIDGLFDIVSDTGLPENVRALAETFAGMVVQIEAREFHSGQLIAELKETQRQLETARRKLESENSDLRQRLKKLDVRYDEQQASEEVREIAESSYFRDLRERAKSMRSRYKPGG